MPYLYWVSFIVLRGWHGNRERMAVSYALGKRGYWPEEPNRMFICISEPKSV